MKLESPRVNFEDEASRRMNSISGPLFLFEILSRYLIHHQMDNVFGGMGRTAIEHTVEAIGYPVFACALASLFLLNGRQWNEQENTNLQKFILPVALGIYGAFHIITETVIQPLTFGRDVQWPQLIGTGLGLVAGLDLLRRTNEGTTNSLTRRT
jgi:hypothetical protein